MLKLIGGSGLCVREECKEGTVWESDPKLCGTSCCLVVSLSVPCFFFHHRDVDTWKCTAGNGTAARHGTAQHGTAPHSTARHRTRVARHSTAQHGTVRHHTARQQHGTTPLWYVALSRCQYLFFLSGCGHMEVHGRKWHGITQYSNAWHNTRQGNARQHMARQQTPQRHTAQQHKARRGTASGITRLPQHETAAARHETATA